ncbi:MAG: HmuY family protein [Luteibaculum sp.]
MKSLKFIFPACILLLASCEKDPDDVFIPSGETTQASGFEAEQNINELPADTSYTNSHTFFNFISGEVVDPADSASNKWHIALSGTTILVNSGVSGPGQVGGQFLSGNFAEITSFPSQGYKTDEADDLAFGRGSGTSWYNYNHQERTVSPIPGKNLILKLTETTFVKMEILSYYKGAPEKPNSSMQARLYTFRYQVFNQ